MASSSVGGLAASSAGPLRPVSPPAVPVPSIDTTDAASAPTVAALVPGSGEAEPKLGDDVLGSGSVVTSTTVRGGAARRESAGILRSPSRMSDASSDTGGLLGLDIGGTLAKMVLFVPDDMANKLKAAADYLVTVRAGREYSSFECLLGVIYRAVFS